MNTDNKSKRILVVLTGGTICSKFEGNIKRNTNNTGLILEQSFNDSYSPFANTVEFKLTDSYEIFSENMTIAKWNTLIKNFRSIPEIVATAKNHGNYPSLRKKSVVSSDDDICDGIIIAHGTDTLAYSSSLFSLLFKEIGVPVFIVSSNEALSADCANGTDNFISAVDCICMGIKPNIYVTYKNTSDGNMYLHYASRLKQCSNYQSDFFSTGMIDISTLCPANAFQLFKKLPRSHYNMECKDEISNNLIVDLFDDWELKNSILKIEPYVGLNYDFFNLEDVDVVLHGAYHSGTVCSDSQNAENDIHNTIKHLSCKFGDKPIYIAPSDVSGNIYETSENIMDCKNLYFVNGFTNEMIYAKLLIAYSYEPIKNKAHLFLANEYNHEIIIDLTGDAKLIYHQ